MPPAARTSISPAALAQDCPPTIIPLFPLAYDTLDLADLDAVLAAAHAPLPEVPEGEPAAETDDPAFHDDVTALVIPPVSDPVPERSIFGPRPLPSRPLPERPVPAPMWRRLFGRLWRRAPGPSPAPPPLDGSAPPARSAPARSVRPFVESPAPWEGGEALVGSDLDQSRVRLVERLYELREGAPSRNDWRFVDRLLRACTAPRLDFPLFPEGALRLDRLLRGPDPPRAKVVDVVRQEPGMVQRVWQEARSAAFGSSPPTTLDEAITRLGHRRLWQISMSACMNAQVFQVRGYQPRANHLRAVSIVAADVSRIFGPDCDPFLPALLHALGKLVVYRCGPARPPNESASPTFVAAVADVVYPSVGVLIAGAWDLGPAVAAGIGFAPAPDQAWPAYREMALATRAASIAAHEAWAEREGHSFDGFAALTALGFPPAVIGRALDAAEAAWRRSELQGTSPASFLSRG